MKTKKAVFFSLDALVAISVILLALIVIFPLIKYSEQETNLPGDIISTLSSLKISEINNTYVGELISQGKITNYNNTILEQIGEFYVTNLTIARELGTSILNELNTTENIGIWYGTKLIASKNSTPSEDAEKIEINRQIISGISEGNSTTGYSSKAYLSANMPKKYYYFGGYVGEGNISLNVNSTNGVNDFEIEFAINRDFDVYINDIYSGHYENASSPFTPAKYDLDAYTEYFHSGENTIKITGNNLYIAGGYAKIIFSNYSFYEQPTRYYFPGIEGLINLYDGFYIPGELNDMRIKLHMDTDQTVFFKIANITIFNNKTNGEETIYFNKSELLSIVENEDINFSFFIEKTIPLRLGMENASYITNKSKEMDIVSVTDLSGSMSGDKLSNAKEANNALIDVILNESNSKIGLVGYRSSVSPDDCHNLSRDESSLKTKINEWEDGGGTCICCGINEAIDYLEIFKAITIEESWKVTNESYSEWNQIDYDDSSWEDKKMPGFAYILKGEKKNYSEYNSIQWACEKTGTTDLPSNNLDCTSYAETEDYNSLELSDDNRWTTTGTNETDYYESQIFTFEVSDIEKLRFYWEGHDTISNTGYGTSIYVWNVNDNTWDFKSTKEFETSEDDNIIVDLLNTTNYISESEQISFLVAHKHYIGSSCPYLYSWNGSDYVFDSEGITSYPLFEEYEGKQPSKLPNLKQDRTKYKILIKEELEEDSYIDNVELLRISHSEDVEIYPVLNYHKNLYDKINKFLPMKNLYHLRYLHNKLSDNYDFMNADFFYSFESVKNLKEPLTAFENKEPVNSLLKEDDIYWNTDFKEGKRNVELAFEKPENVKNAKLLIKYKEDEFISWFGARILEKINDNIDPDKKRFYERTFEDFSLKIEYWNGKKWKYGGTLLDFPREKASKVIMPLNIGLLNENKLKIRLSALSKTMLIDSIKIDYSESNFDIEKVKLKKAIKNNKDVFNKLSKSDKNRITLKGSSNEKVELVFDNGKYYNPETNSFFLNIRGYYEPYKKDFDLNEKEVNKMLKESGFIHKRILKEYEKELKKQNSLKTDFVYVSEISVPSGEWYLRNEFNLNEIPGGSKAYVYVDDKAEIYLNENLIYNITSDNVGEYWNYEFSINSESFNIGDNTIAVKLINNDNESVGFDFKLNTYFGNEYKSMIVMSDGQANGECSEQGTGSATEDAIQAACDAYNDFEIVVHAVGFGSSADEDTLRAIADCGNGSYYFGDVDELVEIYQQLAEEIIEAAYSEQTIQSTGNITTILYPDSYIEFNYTESTNPYGITMISEKDFSDSSHGTFTLPENSTIIETKVLSYSGSRWTDNVKINNQNIFNLSEYDSDYIELGDPYAINSPNKYINSSNEVYLTTGLSPQNSTTGSPSNKIIYTVVKELNSYSSISAFAQGCEWKLDFEDETNTTITIPSNYTGENKCSYTEAEISYDTNDAIQTAVYNLFTLMDFDSDGKLDVKFTEQDFQINSFEITGIPYSWSTEIQVRRWR